LKKVEDFFIRVLDRKVEGAEMQKEGSRFSAYRDRVHSRLPNGFVDRADLRPEETDRRDVRPAAPTYHLQ